MFAVTVYTSLAGSPGSPPRTSGAMKAAAVSPAGTCGRHQLAYRRSVITPRPAVLIIRVDGTTRRMMMPRAWACSSAESKSRIRERAVGMGRGPRRSASARLSPSIQFAVRYANVPISPAA